ncbi:hypothetical protein KCV01_g5947, partial [Aureobasidium melanogenum]
MIYTQRSSLLTAIALATTLVALSSSATALPPAEVVDAFDKAILTGFPATVDIPLQTAPARAKRQAGDTSPGHLTIHGSTPATIRFPGNIQARSYEGSMDGRSVVITRSEDHMDISGPGVGGMHILGFSKGATDIEKIVIPDIGTDDASAPFAPRRARRSEDLPEGVVDRKVELNIFIHDDTKQYMTPRHIHAGYVAWWLTEMDRYALPFVTIDLVYHTAVHRMTNIPYMHSKALDDWTNMVNYWAEDEYIDAEETHLNKFLLITLIDPVPGVTGIAWQGGNTAIAAINGRYRIVAHELGHLFGATHDKAEVRYREGWWCESNMYSTALMFRSNCYSYSDANRRRMRAYVVEGPGASEGTGRGPAVIN